MSDVRFIRFPDMENLSSAMAMKSRAIQCIKPYWTGWSVTEKLDGANFSIAVTKDGETAMFTRNGPVNAKETFYGIRNELWKLEGIKSGLKAELENAKIYRQLTLFGEYYGKGIIKRIPYGDKAFRFYAMAAIAFDDSVYWYPFDRFKHFMLFLGGEEHMVPVLADNLTWEQAIRYPNLGKSWLCDATMEGVVIQPSHESPVDGHTHFRFKNKNEQFLETKPQKQTVTPISDELAALKREFESMATESRMWSVFSKLGMPESAAQTETYIKAFIKDCWDEFRMLHPDCNELDKPSQRLIGNLGSVPFQMFQQVMAKNASETSNTGA